MKIVRCFLILLLSTSALASEISLTCQAKSGVPQGVYIEDRYAMGYAQAQAIDAYSSAQLACGVSDDGVMVECQGYWFGRLDHPVQVSLNLKSKQGQMTRFFGGKISLICE